MNIKNLFQNVRSKKLNTVTRRAALPIAEDYDTDEPNVRLSRAFLVVMLLHVVAVGGIFAFSSLKKNTPAPLPTPLVETPMKIDDLPTGDRTYVVTGKDTLGSIASSFGLTSNDLEAANHLKGPEAIKSGDKLIIPVKSAAQPMPLNVPKLLQLSQNSKGATSATNKEIATVSASQKIPKIAEPAAPANAKIYVVQKGDNPVLIAKRQGIKYADLLEANKITDPKKLQIGQKLIIPQK